MALDLSMLWPHQTETFNFGKDKPGMLDFSSPGIGKSLAHAKLAEQFLLEGGSRVVVTCPKSLVRSAWLEEFTKYSPHLTIALAEAPEANRKRAFESNSDVVVMNVDGFSWLVNQTPRWLKKHFGPKALLINDESHALKNPAAYRTKAAFELAKYFVKRHCLSGTPAPNSVVELWSQSKLVDDGMRLGKRYTAFRNFMQQPISKGPFVNWQDKPDATAITYGLLRDILIRHAFDEVMPKVPAMEHRILYYDLPSAHRKLYEKLEKEEYLAHEGKEISALNAASLAGKLLQCASGASYVDYVGEQDWTIFDDGRYKLIADLVEARPHSIVFFSWKHQKYAIEKELKARKLSYAVIDGDVKSSAKRQEIVTAMQAGELRCVLGHPLSIGHGLTMTKATSVIFASPMYRADMYEQGTARIRRGTQDKVTESIIILGRDTRDEEAYKVFTGKMSRMQALNSLFERKFS